MSGGSVHLEFSITRDEVAAFQKALANMQAKDVMVGFPAGEKQREDENGHPISITNAALAFIHNGGSPEQNIPARPFMVEGIESKREPIATGMESVGIAALDGDSQKVEQGLIAVGLIAKQAIQQKIVDGPFQPLAESTLEGRARRGGAIGKAAQDELDRRATGVEPGTDLARPLNETGQMRNAVQAVLRDNPSLNRS